MPVLLLFNSHLPSYSLPEGVANPTYPGEEEWKSFKVDEFNEERKQGGKRKNGARNERTAKKVKMVVEEKETMQEKVIVEGNEESHENEVLEEEEVA